MRGHALRLKRNGAPSSEEAGALRVLRFILLSCPRTLPRQGRASGTAREAVLSGSGLAGPARPDDRHAISDVRDARRVERPLEEQARRRTARLDSWASCAGFQAMETAGQTPEARSASGPPLRLAGALAAPGMLLEGRAAPEQAPAKGGDKHDQS